jgi:predicted nuclease of predicted toxin-antitoxin system
LKLLFDENLSPRLIGMIEDVYPGSCHVEGCGLSGASDHDVWQHAKENGFAVVTKDADFSELSLLRGAPPKVIWLRIGNCAASRAGLILRNSSGRIQAFLISGEENCLTLSFHPR